MAQYSDGEAIRRKNQRQNQQRNQLAQQTKKPIAHRVPVDFTLLFVVVTLMLFGVVMIFSASYYTTMTRASYNYDMFYYLKRQSAWVVLGIIAMIFAMNIPYGLWRRFSVLMYWFSNALLALLPVIGVERGGQKRWIGITETMSFQPSEFTKLALAVFLSHYVIVHREELKKLQGFAITMFFLAIPVGLIAMTNFSSALLVLLMGATIVFIGSPKIWYFFAGLGVAIPLGAIAIALQPYRLSRIYIWFDPWLDPQGDGFQTIQGLYAVASGGLFGLGLGQSRQKTFVPESHNDIIFAIICEELGIVGAALVIVLFAVLIWRGIKVAIKAKDAFGTLLATGITSVIAFQAIINIGVVTNTIPNTGQPLPFISYGGTSLLFLSVMVGILLNISKYQKE